MVLTVAMRASPAIDTELIDSLASSHARLMIVGKQPWRVLGPCHGISPMPDILIAGLSCAHALPDRMIDHDSQGGNWRMWGSTRPGSPPRFAHAGP